MQREFATCRIYIKTNMAFPGRKKCHIPIWSNHLGFGIPVSGTSLGTGWSGIYYIREAHFTAFPPPQRQAMYLTLKYAVKTTLQKSIFFIHLLKLLVSLLNIEDESHEQMYNNSVLDKGYIQGSMTQERRIFTLPT